jgi:hypothetical protein
MPLVNLCYCVFSSFEVLFQEAVLDIVKECRDGKIFIDFVFFKFFSLRVTIYFLFEVYSDLFY